MFTTPLDIWTLRESQKKGGHQPRGDTGSEEKERIHRLFISTSWCRGRGATLVRSKSSSPNRQVNYLHQFPHYCFAFFFPRLTSQISVLISLLVSYLLTVLSFYPSAAKVKEPGNGSSCELASLFIILCTLKHLHGILYRLEKILILFQKANLLVRRQREMVAR